MDKERNELKEYLAKKGKATTTKATSNNKSNSASANRGIKHQYAKIVSLVKKWGYKLLKFVAFSMFMIKIEQQFHKMRVHISKNGGLRKQGYGGHRPY